MIQELSPAAIRQRIQKKETFVLNVVTAWCPDCIERQAPQLPVLAKKLEEGGLELYQCCVQIERQVFITEEHRLLTADLGGHGYPRTLLILDGELVASQVEVMDASALLRLAEEFLGRLA